jgi:hypothetical protein
MSPDCPAQFSVDDPEHERTIGSPSHRKGSR